MFTLPKHEGTCRASNFVLQMGILSVVKEKSPKILTNLLLLLQLQLVLLGRFATSGETAYPYMQATTESAGLFYFCCCYAVVCRLCLGIRSIR
mmetsp:Transcript_18592/g.30208  ORF Transcript_18592/g.30208 Transcript_18592/m.30208 type:complete len:93 (+) Transcript_18592:90-368(+)